MLATLEHSIPSVLAVLLGALHVRRGVTRQIGKHVKQVNAVIQWALEQQPPVKQEEAAKSE